MPTTTGSWNYPSKYVRTQNDTIVSSGTSVSRVGSMSRISVRTPGFGAFRRTRRGMPSNLPINPFIYSLIDRRFGEGWSETHYTSSGVPIIDHTSGNHASLGPLADGGTLLFPSSDDITAANEKLTNKLLDKLKDSKVNLAQVFFERKLTADLIANSAMRIANSVAQLKRGNIKGAVQLLGVGISRRKASRFSADYRTNAKRAVSNGWLEIQYGWRPLLQDIYGSAELLAKKQSREVRSKVVANQKLNPRADFILPPGSEGISLHEVSICDWQLSGYIWFSTTGAELSTVKEMGLLNPAYLAWELMPWSFVVDWFIPVGNFLSNLDSTIGLSFNKGGFTEFSRSVSSQTAFARGELNSVGQPTFADVRSSRREINVRRTPLFTFPAPYPPSFKSPFSIEHALNAIALLRQSF